ncbi:MAG TPA: hypothetical protein ENG63_07470, partial [Candidatus Desulfofervidus auxilii]|nr:hypothetical protein [Candidatus Desulfofervidus auxilii]
MVDGVKIFSLSGSHKVGKTTIWKKLKAISEKNWVFIGEFADKILKDLSIEWEELIQNELLYKDFEKIILDSIRLSYEIHKRKVLITDRCFLDCMAYLNIFLNESIIEILLNNWWNYLNKLYV